MKECMAASYPGRMAAAWVLWYLAKSEGLVEQKGRGWRLEVGCGKVSSDQ